MAIHITSQEMFDTVIAPMFDELARTHTNVRFYKVVESEAEDVIHSQGINAFPTFRFYRLGRQLREVRGADLPALQSAITDLTAIELDFDAASNFARRRITDNQKKVVRRLREVDTAKWEASGRVESPGAPAPKPAIAAVASKHDDGVMKTLILFAILFAAAGVFWAITR